MASAVSQDNSVYPQSEEPLRVFISSVIEELRDERQMANDAVVDFPVTQPWLFEYMPASSEAPSNRYLRQVQQADIAIWLVGRKTTQPVINEIHSCMNCGIPLLIFRLQSDCIEPATEKLLKETEKYATWKQVIEGEDLARHIGNALNDELKRRFHHPGLTPTRYEQLRQAREHSLAYLKQRWVSLGVPETKASNLAADLSVGNVLSNPASGLHMVVGVQGSGKTLAVSRLFQQAIDRSQKDYSIPYPLFVNARDMSQPLRSYVEQMGRDYSFNPELGSFIVLDGIDEIGVFRAKDLVEQAAAYADANNQTTLILAGRALPGLNLDRGHRIAMPVMSDQEAIALIGQFTFRTVEHAWSTWPQSIREASRLPLFAVMLGTELGSQPSGNYSDMIVPRPSQLIAQLAQRASENSEILEVRADELLQTLATKAVSYGTPVHKTEVSSKRHDQKFMAESRLINDNGDSLDFTLAVFREWFAARALIERTISVEEVLPILDRWLSPLTIALNSGDKALIHELISCVTASDPGMAGLLLQEHDSDWFAQEGKTIDLETAHSVGQDLWRAMENWRLGLGCLFPAIGPVGPHGQTTTLGIQVKRPKIIFSWYAGEERLGEVVDLPPLLDASRDWSRWTGKAAPDSHAWPWILTKENLVAALDKTFKTTCFPLESIHAIPELAWEISQKMNSGVTIEQMRNAIQQIRHVQSHDQVRLTFPGKPGNIRVTRWELDLVVKHLGALLEDGEDFLVETWPPEDLEAASDWVWSRFSGERLLERTSAIYKAALQIYKDMVDQWFQAFRARLRLYQLMPIEMTGELVFPDNRDPQERGPWLLSRTHVLPVGKQSTVNFVLRDGNRKDQDLEQHLREEEEYEQEEEANLKSLRTDSKIFLSPSSGGEIPHVFGARPATNLAYKWLHHELGDLDWTDTILAWQ